MSDDEISFTKLKKKQIIESLSISINVSNYNFTQYITSFEKLIHSEIKKYSDKSGLTDYKMKKMDYYILLKLYETTNESPYKLEILLFYIYSYYKLDGISYSFSIFPMLDFFNFIDNNNNIHTDILKLIELN